MKIIRANEITDDFFAYMEMEDSAIIRDILNDVKQNGDRAIKKYTQQFDQVVLEDIRVAQKEIGDAKKQIDRTFMLSAKRAHNNIKKFACRQLEQFKSFETEIEPGVIAGQRVIPIERVGVYVPGGRYPLISSLLMCAIPAQVAGVRAIAVCSPPTCNGSIHPAILALADMIGINEIYKVGGAQAIAAMAYGTESIRKVDKIVGPGNKYVTLAKKEVFGVTGIDFIAGPTEIMIIADDSADERYVAADLLAQAEHDVDAVPVLVTTSKKLAEKVISAIAVQIEQLATKETARISLEQNGLIILVDTIEEAIKIANNKAPEHLELQLKKRGYYAKKCMHYGSLFIGKYAAEVLGDYTSGLNHTLPTNLSARYNSGLSVKDFIKLSTTLKVSQKGLRLLSCATIDFAETEGLHGHASSVTNRLRLR